MRADDKEALILQIGYLQNRRIHFDNLFWQIPSLSLTGQAFLLSIALNSGNTRSTRYLSSLLGVLIAVISLISLNILKFYENSTAKFIDKLEIRLYGETTTNGSLWNKSRNDVWEKHKERNWMIRITFCLVNNRSARNKCDFRAHDAWTITLFIFILVGIFIFIATLFQPKWF